jgi:hypothetical protein
MARIVNFQYVYPHSLKAANSRFYAYYDGEIFRLHNKNVETLLFSAPVPYLVGAAIRFTAANDTGSSVLNIPWEAFAYNGAWNSLGTFTMPSAGEYTSHWDANLADVSRVVAVPIQSLSGGTRFVVGIYANEITLRESLTTTDLAADEYFPAFPNDYGVTQRPSKIFANIGGALTPAKKVLVNIGGSLAELPAAYSGAFSSVTPDSMRLFEFTPPASGTYRFEVVRASGDHEARLYDSAFVRIDTDAYFYNGSFALTGGSLYYIALTQYVGNSDPADSVLTIIKS